LIASNDFTSRQVITDEPSLVNKYFPSVVIPHPSPSYLKTLMIFNFSKS